jgi:glycine reductase
MSGSPVRVVHYLNQFFAGLGGEDKAGVAPLLIDGAAGPGKLIAQALGTRAQIVATIACGDNYASEQGDAAANTIVELVRNASADVVILGPAFDAGRYGAACVAIGQRITEALGIPCVTALYPENPGVAVYRSLRNAKLYCLPTTESVAGLREVGPKLAALALRLAAGEVIGPASVEGYIPRGIRRLERSEQPAADRAVAMLIAKLSGAPYHTDMPYAGQGARVPPAKPLTSLAASKVAIVTTAGVVPAGNPDHFYLRSNTFWKKYDVSKADRMEGGKWSAVHGGYSTSWMTQNPNLGVPLDAMRYWESQGVLGKVAPSFYTIPGVGAEFDHAARVGREIAADLKASGIDGALLVST